MLTVSINNAVDFKHLSHMCTWLPSSYSTFISLCQIISALFSLEKARA